MSQTAAQTANRVSLPAHAAAGRIAFQGEPGAYSHMACLDAFPAMEPLPCPTFEAAIAAVKSGEAELAMLPVENSTYGRVADIHSLLPDSGLFIVGETFVPVRIHLLGPRGARLDQVEEAQSHAVLLGQCREFLRSHGIRPVIGADTAGSAAQIAREGDPRRAALASALAAQINDLEVLAEDVQDASHNATRFLVMSRRKIEAEPDAPHVLTSFVFEVRNVPAALYKALGGFATNGVNMVKLESYMVNGSFTATRFYADIEGHPEQRPVRLALEELGFFTNEVKILGVYPAHPYRDTVRPAAAGR
ncbi:prephenate dehydratase [Oceanicella actignis]|uniref:prephenate dehydratase n=1 Tax=Oceanicella actignis TaxID=1189325 RepID=A0A1M7SCV1_9RHOB|nr:prephenate dehydratase [Oceanicella actignis]TYO91407.1 prephenate dehydratase [Oceanicella actignis]SET25820.1 prephenate dehydratase [Oceanicella actignis]SHN56308.1 prephenate dehydratase [Oceanicella actignis]